MDTIQPIPVAREEITITLFRIHGAHTVIADLLHSESSKKQSVQESLAFILELTCRLEAGIIATLDDLELERMIANPC